MDTKQKQKQKTMNNSAGLLTKDLPFISSEAQERRKGRAKKVFQEIITKHFPNLAKPTDQEGKQISYKIKAKISTPRHIIFKLLKTKD